MFISKHVIQTFDKYGVNRDQIKNMMTDLAQGNEMFDEEGKRINRKDAEESLRAFCRDIVELPEKFSRRDFDRAMSAHGREFMQLIEEVLDTTVDGNYRDSEWFNLLTDYRNLANGDDMSFWTENDIILSVATVGKSHHDYMLQRINGGTSYTIPITRYGAAVGIYLNRYFAGQEDFSKMISILANSITQMTQQTIYNTLLTSVDAIQNIGDSVKWVGQGNLDVNTKANFDEIVDNVTSLYGEATIFGTKSALRKINNLVSGGDAVNFISHGQEDSVAATGILGDYEGSPLVMIDQRFITKGNKITGKLYADDKLFILPSGDFKIVDFVSRGETELNEVSQKGEQYGRYDDIGKYELQFEQGVALKRDKRFGAWTLAS